MVRKQTTYVLNICLYVQIVRKQSVYVLSQLNYSNLNVAQIHVHSFFFKSEMLLTSVIFEPILKIVFF